MDQLGADQLGNWPTIDQQGELGAQGGPPSQHTSWLARAPTCFLATSESYSSEEELLEARCELTHLWPAPCYTQLKDSPWYTRILLVWYTRILLAKGQDQNQIWGIDNNNLNFDTVAHYTKLGRIAGQMDRYLS